jgi:hypothetical protein
MNQSENEKINHINLFNLKCRHFNNEKKENCFSIQLHCFYYSFSTEMRCSKILPRKKQTFFTYKLHTSLKGK